MIKAQKIYVAGPYSASDADARERNVERAIQIAVLLIERGHYPFIPHLTHYVDEWTRKTAHELTWEDYIAWDVVWLQECDALYYIGSSRGADLERQIAEHLGKRIYESIDEIPLGDGRTTVHEEVAHLLTDVLPPQVRSLQLAQSGSSD